MVDQINELENDFKVLTDTELRKHNFRLQTEYKETNNLNNLIGGISEWKGLKTS